MTKESRERIVQKSASIRQRQSEFLDWASQNLAGFNWNNMVRDVLDRQIKIFNSDYLENE